MAIAVAQVVHAVESVGGVTSFSISATVQAGSTLHLFAIVTGENLSDLSFYTVADNLNPNVSWNGPLDANDYGGGNIIFMQYSLASTVAGAVTVTIQSDQFSETGMILYLVEITGADPGPGLGLDGHTSNFQSSPGSSTDAMTSGSVTSAHQPALVLGWGTTGFAVLAAGTGFTLEDSASAIGLVTLVEAKRVTATGSQAATFTMSAPLDVGATMVAVYDELAAPLITVQPVSQSAYPGAPVTMGLTAVASAGSITGYQWNKNGSPISGATTNPYTASYLMADNGAVFTCDVTDSNGTRTSKGATLTLTAPLYTALPMMLVGPVGAASSTALVLSAGVSLEIPGAPSLAATVTPSGGLSLEVPGSAIAVAIRTLAAGITAESPGAWTMAGVLAPAGARSSEAAGSWSLSASLNPAGGPAAESSGAPSLAGLAAPSAGASAEGPGAPTTAGTSALAGARSLEAPGAATLAAIQALAAGPSQEQTGAAAILRAAILAAGQSGEASGAGSLIGLLAPAGGASAERAGAPSLAAIQALTGGLSTEVAGGAALVVTSILAGAASLEGAGSPTLAALAALTGGISAETPGALHLTGLAALAAGISGEAAGVIQTLQGIVTLLLAGGLGLEAAGPTALSVTISPTAGAFSEAPGASLLFGTLQLPAGLSEELAGALQVHQGAVFLALAAGATSEASGQASLTSVSALSGAESGDSAGAPSLESLLRLIGGPSSEGPGVVLLVDGTIIVILAGGSSGESPGANQARVIVIHVALSGTRPTSSFGADVRTTATSTTSQTDAFGPDAGSSPTGAIGTQSKTRSFNDGG